MNNSDFIISPLESNSIGEMRRITVSKAEGKVLEIGIGSGANLPFYIWSQISSFVAIDKNIKSKTKRLSKGYFKVLKGDAENLPFLDNTFNSVVATLLLCTVFDSKKVLKEINRVLKPGGKYIFIEHVLPERKGLANLFNLVNPLWSKVVGGCNINKNTDVTISESGFKILTLQKNWKTVGCFGIAEKPR